MISHVTQYYSTNMIHESKLQSDINTDCITLLELMEPRNLLMSAL